MIRSETVGFVTKLKSSEQITTRLDLSNKNILRICVDLHNKTMRVKN